MAKAYINDPLTTSFRTDNLEDETLALKTSLLWKSIKHLGCKDLDFKEPETEEEETGLGLTSLEMEAMGIWDHREKRVWWIPFVIMITI